MSLSTIDRLIYINSLATLTEHIKDDPSVVNQLIKGRSPLYLAVLRNQVEIAELLIKSGADVNFKYYCPNNNTLFPVFHRVLNNEKLMILMIEHGVDINITDGQNNTALHGFFNTPATIKILIDNGGFINALNIFGQTPLHRLVSFSNSDDVVEVLLKYGANPNLADHDGCTPLQKAVNYNSPKNVKLLLEYGADLYVLNSQNYTIRQTAVEMEYNDVLAVIDEFESSLEIKEPDEST